MPKRQSQFRRPGGRYLPQPVVLVLCEDKKSGKRYLEDAAIHFRVKVLIQVSHVGKTDPIGIVNEAISQQRKYDQIFCVIDRDEHPSFDDALRLAKGAPNVVMIPSYPCFEFWLLLHFGFTRRPYRTVSGNSAANQLISDLREQPDMRTYDKGSNESYFRLLLGPRFLDARNHAPRVLAEALRDGELNPSTKIHELLEYYESLSSPREAPVAPL